MTDEESKSSDELVPDDVIPSKHLPPLKYRDLPESISWKKMVGPSIMLAGLALGSGEFVLWPYITFKSGYIFFWACLLGVITQYFLNMEIERWTLATGESAITGFCRLTKHWAWIMLLLNIIPWAWPGWATGAGTIFSWMIFGPEETVNANGQITFQAQYVSAFGILGLVVVGIVLTAGPVVYNTVEKIQTFLVALILILVVFVSALVVRWDAVLAMLAGAISFGQLPDAELTNLDFMTLLGALAFAGAGGSTNLGQSNFIKDKGYGMGKYIGRITSPLTGQEEAVADTGFFFHRTEDNLSRWRQWWKAANVEHVFSFFATCLACLCLMTLITYSLSHDSSGNRIPELQQFGSGLNFIWGQATILEQHSLGMLLKYGFLIMGIAVLLTTELGVLDVVARISTDIVKVNWLRDNNNWSLSKLYFCFLWGEILLGSLILLLPNLNQPLMLLVLSAAMNGVVMFVYSGLLLYLNRKVLAKAIAMSPVRVIALLWSCLFFGYFSFQALRLKVIPEIQELFSAQ